MYTDEVETREVNGRTYTVKAVVEEYPDLSWYGEYTDRVTVDWYVDRINGTLRGPATVEEPYEDDEKYDISPCLNCSHSVECDSMYGWCDQYIVQDWDDDGYQKDYEAWEQSTVYAEYLSTRDTGHEYKYFVPMQPDERGYEGGSEEFTKYTVMDYERVSEYNKGWWCVLYVEASTHYPDEKGVLRLVGNGSGGIESDIEDDELEEIVKDLIAQCEYELERVKV